MITALECVPCIVRQTLEAAQLVSDDVAFQEEVVRRTLKHLATVSYQETPPVVAARVHAEIRRLLDVEDPYKRQKDHFNQLALDLRPTLEREVEHADDPLEQALRFSVAGNVVDFGIHADINEADLYRAIEHAAEVPLVGNVESFRRHAEDADRILFLADNTGEIVFDRLLIQHLPHPERVTVAVRGGPIINDATVEDAQFAGISDIVPVISNGAVIPGTDLESC